MQNTKPNLTIILPIYNPSTPLENIFENLIKQKDQNFNLIVTLDKPSEEGFEIINKMNNIFKDRMKLIINSTHQIFHTVLQQAIKMVETEYTFIMYSYVYVKNEFIKRINEFIDKSEIKPDFIEINGIGSGLVKHELKSKKIKEQNIYNIQESKEAILMISPFSFNKILKTNIVDDLYNLVEIKNANLQYSIDFVYFGILKAKNFAYIQNTWIEDFNEQLTLFNPKDFHREWCQIFKEYGEDKTVNLILTIAYFKHMKRFVPGYLGSIKTRRSDSVSKSIKMMQKSLIESVNNFNLKHNDLLNSKDLQGYLKAENLDKNDLFEDTNKWKEILKHNTW
ncbi:glycosyltransferase [[Mycoplasma] anseris]|uniref:Glycosyltransferase n=1 Tax=[Mycoplasma] anseris TaxID=92400 RepID=A0A2Z4ND38_9BACT|nr:glycosyltransferase [[Mycoplasma] anseris]AWX69482.1 glycosyltransferase [[Mycoplasma] anseris]